MVTQLNALRLAQALNYRQDVYDEAAAELRRLHDLLGKANALARIRGERILELVEQLQSRVTCFERWEDTHNARLIKAAPDLLEALKEMVADFGPTPSDRLPSLKQARYVIAKATGGEV